MSVVLPKQDVPQRNALYNTLVFQNDKSYGASTTSSVITPFHLVADDDGMAEVCIHRRDGVVSITDTVGDVRTVHVHVPFAWAMLTFGRQYLPPRSTFPEQRVTFLGTLRDYQSEVKNDVIQHLNRTHSVLLSLHVGWGKSVFALYIACKLGMPIMLVTHRLVLVRQWMDLAATVTDAECCFLTSSPKSFSRTAQFYFINACNIAKIPADIRARIGVVIVDEVHLICAEARFTGFFHLQPRYMIGLSATPYRNDGLTVLIDRYFGTACIERALVRPHTVHVVRTGLSLDFKLGWDGRMDWNSVLGAQAENPRRNQLMVDIVCNISTLNFLILVKRVEHGRALANALMVRGVTVTDLLGTNQTYDPLARVLIATTQKLEAGFSHDKLDAFIIATDIESYFIQYLGRVFRRVDSRPIIFDFVDAAPGVLYKHFKTREAVYREIGGDIHWTTPDSVRLITSS